MGDVTTGETEEFPGDDKYLIFQALSHPTRVKILALIEGNGFTFSSLKHELGIESSGHLQHHLQKLSGLITEETNGSYGLTDSGQRALEINRESESSGRSLEDICCIPAGREITSDKQVGTEGTLLRFSIGFVLLAAAFFVVYFTIVQNPLGVHINGSSVSFGIWGEIIFGFFGVSFLIAALTRYPGCEITAIPNLLTGKKRYCSCMITPFNLPNGRLLRRE